LHTLLIGKPSGKNPRVFSLTDLLQFLLTADVAIFTLQVLGISKAFVAKQNQILAARAVTVTEL
jgi:hypothetical protein